MSLCSSVSHYVILYPNLTTLMNFDTPKLLVKLSGSFFVRRMKKSHFILKLLNKICGKTNVETHTAQLKENLIYDSKK